MPVEAGSLLWMEVATEGELGRVRREGTNGWIRGRNIGLEIDVYKGNKKTAELFLFLSRREATEVNLASRTGESRARLAFGHLALLPSLDSPEVQGFSCLQSRNRRVGKWIKKKRSAYKLGP